MKKIFCISMQRSGTTSVGDWLEAHGLKRAGWKTARRNGWDAQCARGDFEAIYASRDFVDSELFEDAPWWAPDYYRPLAARFPDARFILLERDPEAWFRSMCHHSGGRNPGRTDFHCMIYDRLADLEALQREGRDATGNGLLDITRHGEHYKRRYRLHTTRALEFFAAFPGRLLHGSLDDPGIFERMCPFAGVAPNPAIAPPRSNATSEAMRARLASYLKAREER